MIVVRSYEHLMMQFLKVVPSLLHHLHVVYKHLADHCFVRIFKGVFLRGIVDQHEKPAIVILIENAGNSNASYISLQSNQLCWVHMPEIGCMGEVPFDCLKHKLSIPS